VRPAAPGSQTQGVAFEARSHGRGDFADILHEPRPRHERLCGERLVRAGDGKIAACDGQLAAVIESLPGDFAGLDFEAHGTGLDADAKRAVVGDGHGASGVNAHRRLAGRGDGDKHVRRAADEGIAVAGLDVVFAGGETATVEAFKKAQENKEWLIGYFWEPQYVHAEVPLERVKLPPYKDGCDADKAKVACDYAETQLKKVASKAFMDSGSPAATLVQVIPVRLDGMTSDTSALVAATVPMFRATML